MIKYKLVCKNCNFLFDSWFASSKEFERLKNKNFINCHKCNSSKVEKTLMSPSVVKSKNSILLNKNKKYQKIKKTISEYQKFIKKNFKYVGDNFAYEARSIHYNNKKEKKGIYGSATKKELKELRDEGIETQMVPWIEDKNN